MNRFPRRTYRVCIPGIPPRVERNAERRGERGAEDAALRLNSAAGAKKSTSSWLTRSASSWWTQCDALGRRSTPTRFGTSLCSGSASLRPRKRSRCPQMTSVGAEIGLIAVPRLPRRREHRVAVVVDHPGQRSRLRPRLDVAVHLLRRVRGTRVAEEAAEEPEVLRPHDALGEPREGEEEEVPAAAGAGAA